MTDNALGIDVSRYNGLVNWDVAKAQGVVFAGMRASISYAYRDPYIARNRDECIRLGIYRLPYHVLYPGENIQAQVNNFLAGISTEDTNYRPVLDLELTRNQAPGRITTDAIEWLERVADITGVNPIIYSRASWVNENTTPGLWKSKYDWWLASYLSDRKQERPAPPTLPHGGTSWLIHQNCDQRPAWPGFAGENGISTVDINRWNGDAAAVAQYFNPQQAPTWQQEIDAWARTMGYTGVAPE